MKRKLLKPALRALLLVAIYLPFLAATTGERAAGTVPEFPGRINAFAFDLLKYEAGAGGARGGGMLVSPLSIFSGLAMSYVASGGETRRGLAQALHFPADNVALERDLADLRGKLAGDGARGGVELHLADAVWLDTTRAEFRQDYLREAMRLGAGPARGVKFAEAKSGAGEINAWTSAATNGRIPAVLQPGDSASRSRPGRDVIDEPGLVAVDAAWFKAEWTHRFDRDGTAQRMFYITPGAAGREVAMMHQSALFLYSEDARFQFLEMPYLGGRFSMMVLLPRENSGVEAAMTGLTPETVMDLKRRAAPQYADVLFPKFTIRSSADMKPALSAMGAGAAFDSRHADFDAMIVKKPEAYRVYLAGVHHDAWMETGEEGTEAAAATVSVHYTIGCSAQEPPRHVEFHADHPFLFFIVHNPSRCVVFAGWIANPAGAGDE